MQLAATRALAPPVASPRTAGTSRQPLRVPLVELLVLRPLAGLSYLKGFLK